MKVLVSRTKTAGVGGGPMALVVSDEIYERLARMAEALGLDAHQLFDELTPSVSFAVDGTAIRSTAPFSESTITEALNHLES